MDILQRRMKWEDSSGLICGVCCCLSDNSSLVREISSAIGHVGNKVGCFHQFWVRGMRIVLKNGTKLYLIMDFLNSVFWIYLGIIFMAGRRLCDLAAKLFGMLFLWDVDLWPVPSGIIRWLAGKSVAGVDCTIALYQRYFLGGVWWLLSC